MIRSIAFLPETATADARVLVAARTVRAFGDGFVSALLAAWLKEIGFPSWQVGAITTTTPIGSAALTLTIGLLACRWRSACCSYAACSRRWTSQPATRT